MRAITVDRYGGPETLEYRETDDPKVGPDSVLVRVKAAGVNPVDWKIVAGYLDSLCYTHFPLVPGWDGHLVAKRLQPSLAGHHGLTRNGTDRGRRTSLPPAHTMPDSSTSKSGQRASSSVSASHPSGIARCTSSSPGG